MELRRVGGLNEFRVLLFQVISTSYSWACMRIVSS